MSLQDDYFDLEDELTGENRQRFLRIWSAFVDMENEHEDLLKIRSAVRTLVSLTFKDDE